MDNNFHLFIWSIILIIIGGEKLVNVSGNADLSQNCQHCRNFGFKLMSKKTPETPQHLGTLKLKEPAESIAFENNPPNFGEKAWKLKSEWKIVLNLKGNMERLKTPQQMTTLKHEKTLKNIVLKKSQFNVKMEEENFQQDGQNLKPDPGNLFKRKKRLETQQRLATLNLKKIQNIVVDEVQQKFKEIIKKNLKPDSRSSTTKMAENLFRSKEPLEAQQLLAIDQTENQFKFKTKNFIQKTRFEKILKKYFDEKDLPETKQHLVTLNPKNSIELFNLKETSTEIHQILLENLSISNLKSLKYHFKVDTLVLYGQWKILPRFEQIFKSNHSPVVKITDSIEWKLKDLFSSHILSIVFLGAEYSLEKQILDTFKQSLKGAHLQKVIFITQIPIKEDNISEEFRQLFNWLHVNGFWQSLLMDLEGSTLSFENLIGEFKRNLTLRDFLNSDTKWFNLQGFSINCAMGSNPPRAYIQRDLQNKVTLKGYYGTIINLFVKHYNASLNPVVLSNLDYYTELDCVKYINAEKVDICGDGMPLHSAYVVSYTDELMASYLMVPYDKPLPRFYYFLKPFQLNVWTLVTCSFIFKVITLSIIHRLQYGSWNTSLHMLFALLSVLFLPFHLSHIKGHYCRFLEMTMILGGFLIANWYLSVLSSLLFTRLYNHDIQSPQDLAAHNISIMVDKLEHYLLNATENNPIIMQQLKVVSNEILLEHRRNLDPHYAYYSQYDKVAFYLHQQKFLLRPRMKILTGIPPINKILGGVPMSINWPFQHLLTDFIRCLSESGLYERFYADALEEGITSGYLHYFPTEYHYVEPLTLEYFQMAAILLAVGYSLAVVSFILELVVVFKFKNTQVVLKNN